MKKDYNDNGKLKENTHFLKHQSMLKNISIPKGLELDNIDLDSYELLVLPGGVKSMELLRLDNAAINLVKEFNSAWIGRCVS